MAQAPAHTLGQIVGNALERAVEPLLRAFADEHDLYLDMKGRREARGKKTKVSWEDSLGNVHDLDFVLERGGTTEEVGIPVAFVETAWRRYTKHSRNKAQEIQAAILPLRERHKDVAPTSAVVLGGVFTSESLQQLQSSCFAVLFVPATEVFGAFEAFGIDVAVLEETPDEYVQEQVEAYRGLDEDAEDGLIQSLQSAVRAHWPDFEGQLRDVAERKIASIALLPLRGEERLFDRVQEAVDFIAGYDLDSPEERQEFRRFEVLIRYSNGDRITGEFEKAEEAMSFLDKFRADEADYA